MLSAAQLEALWLDCVAAYDDSQNPPPDFASAAAVRETLRGSGLTSDEGFEAALVCVLGSPDQERLLDYIQFCSLLELLLPVDH